VIQIFQPEVVALMLTLLALLVASEKLGGYVFSHISLLVGWFVSRITQKILSVIIRAVIVVVVFCFPILKVYQKLKNKACIIAI